MGAKRWKPCADIREWYEIETHQIRAHEGLDDLLWSCQLPLRFSLWFRLLLIKHSPRTRHHLSGAPTFTPNCVLQLKASANPASNYKARPNQSKPIAILPVSGRRPRAGGNKGAHVLWNMMKYEMIFHPVMLAQSQSKHPSPSLGHFSILLVDANEIAAWQNIIATMPQSDVRPSVVCLSYLCLSVCQHHQSNALSNMLESIHRIIIQSPNHPIAQP